MTAVVEVDRYVLREPIAVGGMATVYFARQRGAAGFSKAVAIKRMRPDLVHQREFVELFVDEARLASRVRHANVVSVIDVVASGEELLLVMEYFHGESLARLLAAASRAGERVPPAIAVAIAVNVLHGLHAAHEAKDERGEPLGIVHRDVSPQNVLVGVDGVARVADFGIARAAGQLHATEDGKTRGKAGYSAPEQLRGGPVTRRIDLFAVCALLWEALVGRRLFDGETQAAVVAAVLTEAVEAPGIHAPELPEELDEVVLRGLDRDPSRRPGDALELAAALERAVTPAGPAAVSAWVLELAGEELARREEIVRRIESGADETPATAAAAALAASDATGSLATSRSPSAPTARRARAFPLAAAGLGIVLGIAIAIATAIAVRTPPAGAGPPTAEAPSSSAISSTTSSDAPPSAAVSLELPTSAAGAASAASAPPARPAASRAAKPPPRPKARRCDPPYDLDPAGRKIFRVECL
ncbi:MAG: serine/threonine protein kinase [Labilithrix sp.]|nr:serine/threonine protein kinase [Labilithrix sp.]